MIFGDELVIASVLDGMLSDVWISAGDISVPVLERDATSADCGTFVDFDCSPEHFVRENNANRERSRILFMGLEFDSNTSLLGL